MGSRVVVSGGPTDRLLAVVAPALFAAIALVGCGGSAGADLSDWRAGADAICAEWDREVHGLGQATTLAEVAAVTRRGSVLGRRHLERLRSLRAPTRQEPEINGLLAALERVVASLEAVASAAGAGDPQATDQAAQALLRASTAADGRVAELGLRECLSDDG